MTVPMQALGEIHAMELQLIKQAKHLTKAELARLQTLNASLYDFMLTVELEAGDYASEQFERAITRVTDRIQLYSYYLTAARKPHQTPLGFITPEEQVVDSKKRLRGALAKLREECQSLTCLESSAA